MTENREKKGLFARLREGMTKTRDSITHAIDQLTGVYKELDDDFYDDLEAVLIGADIGVKTTEEIIARLKDEVRRLGLELGLPENMVWRQPFPGPGLAVRIIGDITREKVEILKDADAIFREEIDKAGLSRDINQYFAVLTNMRSVGVMGDERTYDFTVALRAVCTVDFMTVDWARIPYDVLARASARIVNEVRSVNRVVYDITTKPPATIEWE